MGKEKLVFDPTKAPIVTKVKDKEFEATVPKEQPKKEPKPKEKPKPQPEPKPTFPMECKINAYGFLHFNSEMREAFGIPEGKKVPETRITIDFKDGALIIKKA